jgi:uncharacterized protein
MSLSAALTSYVLASAVGLGLLTTTAFAAEDAADAIIAANVVKSPALAGLPNVISAPSTPAATAANINNSPNTATANSAIRQPSIDAGNGEMLALPSLNAPVIDQASALSAADNQQLSNQLRAIHQAGRAQIGLILIKSTKGESIFDYAGRVFSAWKLGDAERDNGLLIVVATQDRKIQILTGYGLEGIIPDIVASRIIREQITPQFKMGLYAAGLGAGIGRIDSILQQDPEIAKAAANQMKAQQRQQGSQTSPLSGGLILLLIVLVVIGQFTQMIFGRVLNSGGLAAAGVGIGLFTGAGLAGSLFIGGAVFTLLLVGVLPFLNMLGSSMGGDRGGGFGGFGGGGSFGGGGASGSW